MKIPKSMFPISKVALRKHNRYSTGGVHLKTSESNGVHTLRASATDGQIFIESEVQVDEPLHDPIIIKKEDLEEFAKMLPEEGGAVVATEKGKKFSMMTMGDWQFRVNHLKGKFPNTSGLFPKEEPVATVLMDVSALHNLIATLYEMSSPNCQSAIRMDIYKYGRPVKFSMVDGNAADGMSVRALIMPMDE